MGHEIGCSEFTMPNSCDCRASWTREQMLDKIRKLETHADNLENHLVGNALQHGTLDITEIGEKTFQLQEAVTKMKQLLKKAATTILNNCRHKTEDCGCMKLVDKIEEYV